MQEDLNAYKTCLTDYVERNLKSKGKHYICPYCKSGTKTNKTAAFSIMKDGAHWKCFACGKNGDIYDLVLEIECLPDNKDGRAEAARRIVERYGSGQPSTVKTTKPSTQAATPAPAAASTDYTEDIKRFEAALRESPEALAYLQDQRGLTAETIKRFHLGFDPQRRTITIPYDRRGTYYGQRSVDPSSKIKHSNLRGVQIPLFNGDALYTADIVFIVESPLCAISITQEGGTAVAISGTSGGNRLLAQLKHKPTKATLVLCLDNDGAGKKATDDIGTALEGMGILCANGTTAIMGEEENPQAEEYRKDPNDVLQRSGREALREAIEICVSEVKAMREEAERADAATKQAEAERAAEERRIRTGTAMVDDFLKEVQTRRYEPIPTGITDIDRVLYGGFTRQQLVILGAAPGAGKTALAQYIFEGMAKRGTSCIFLNLEMSGKQLLARSLSNRIAQRFGMTITPTQIMQGYRWTDAQRNVIIPAAQEYARYIAPRFVMNPEGLTNDLDDILAYMESEAKLAEAAGESAPLVVIDYLQLINGAPREDTAAVIKRAVSSFKGYAIKHNTLVFAIIAHNRSANSSGSVTMEAARDTSAIEYSADLQLGLTYTACLDGRRDANGNIIMVKESKNSDKLKPYKPTPDELTEDEQQYVTLRVLKGRFGGKNTRVDLHFNGSTMTYTQLVKGGGGFIPTNEPTPFDDPKPITLHDIGV